MTFGLPQSNAFIFIYNMYIKDENIKNGEPFQLPHVGCELPRILLKAPFNTKKGENILAKEEKRKKKRYKENILTCLPFFKGDRSTSTTTTSTSTSNLTLFYYCDFMVGAWEVRCLLCCPFLPFVALFGPLRLCNFPS